MCVVARARRCPARWPVAPPASRSTERPGVRADCRRPGRARGDCEGAGGPEEPWPAGAYACLNASGLATARAIERSRELAVRRALGATSWHLVRRQVAEASWLAGGATCLALLAIGSIASTNAASARTEAFRHPQSREEPEQPSGWRGVPALLRHGGDVPVRGQGDVRLT
jgi:hypothetical protein